MFLGSFPSYLELGARLAIASELVALLTGVDCRDKAEMRQNR